ncbi:hypothetical protein PIB30_010633 [Stylosanthes scabra]|uniref:Uncharacterized protein n=1 Tax=Stylosanthes scabra TaxID=79078 RepID=A0ABU6U4H7_9FABA|nr:hypothetical protein [Stylosanthes scabra]
MSSQPHAPPRPLQKQQSWSPDLVRDEAWQRRRRENKNKNKNNSELRGGGDGDGEGGGGEGHLRLSKSLSEDDLEELKACMELGFGFDSPEIDSKLRNTFPALELYHAVNRQYYEQNHGNGLSRSSSSSSIVSDCDTSTSSPNTTLFLPGDDSAAKKTRLKQWAQIVACAVRYSSPPLSQPQQSDPTNY